MQPKIEIARVIQLLVAGFLSASDCDLHAARAKNCGGDLTRTNLRPQLPSSSTLKQTMMVKKIVTGGQSGVDRAALDVAIDLQIPCGGWCPRGRKAEDGRIPDRYPLKQSSSRRNIQRTEWNVRDSDGTLILSFDPLMGGTLATQDFARQMNKPCLVIGLNQPQSQSIEQIQKWIKENSIQVLNIAGPRLSEEPNSYAATKDLLTSLFQREFPD